MNVDVELPGRVHDISSLAGAQTIDKDICESVASGRWTPNGRSKQLLFESRLTSAEKSHSKCSTFVSVDAYALEAAASPVSTTSATTSSPSPLSGSSQSTSNENLSQIGTPSGGGGGGGSSRSAAQSTVKSGSVLIGTRRVEPPNVLASQWNSSLAALPVGANGKQELVSSALASSALASSANEQKERPDARVDFAARCKCGPKASISLTEKSADSAPKDNSNNNERRPSKQQRGKLPAPFMFAGILGSILGSVFFSSSTLCIKLLPDSDGLAEKTKIVMWRGIIIMLLCSSSIIYQRSTFLVRRDELLVNVLRSIFGFTGVYGSYISLKYISMGDSTALIFSSPLWTNLLSHFILNEPLRWIQLLALPASMLGIVLIAHPALLLGAAFSGPDELMAGDAGLNQSAYDTLTSAVEPMAATAEQALADNSFEQRWPGIVIALLTSLIVSCVYIVLKFRKSTPIQTTTFWLGATTFVGGLVIQLFVGFGSLPQSASEWALICANGTFSWIGQLLMQWSLFYEDASVLSVIRTLDVAMTFTLSAMFLDESILWTSVLGAAIIAAVVVSTVLSSWFAGTQTTSASQQQQQQQQRQPAPALDQSQGKKRASLRQASAAA